MYWKYGFGSLNKVEQKRKKSVDFLSKLAFLKKDAKINYE